MGDTMDSNTLLSLGIMRETAKTIQIQQNINSKERSILKIWRTVIDTTFILITLLVIKIVTFVAIQEHSYADFIQFMNKYRQGYSGPSSLMTALALKSPFFALFFPNRLLPYALYASYQTPSIRALYDTCPSLMETIYNEAATSTATNAVSLLCSAVSQCPGGADACNNNTCTSTMGNTGATGVYVQNMTGQMMNGIMAGHVVSVATAGESGGPLGMLIGCAVGLALGGIQSALEASNNAKLCKQGDCSACS